MKDLDGFDLRGRLPDFINNVFKDSSFNVRVGSTFSGSHPQEMGVPQGSILSVTLFSVKINSIALCLKPGVDCSLYVDDSQICYISSNMSIIERQLQICAGSGASEERSHIMHLFISNYSWTFDTGTVITFLFIQTDHGTGMNERMNV